MTAAPGSPGIPLGQRYPALVAAPLALLGIWLASVLGLFESIEGMLYDQLWRIPYGAERGSRVLLIEVDARRLDSEDPLWSRLLEQLQASGARPLVFGFVPPRASTEFFQRAAAAQVLLARRPLKDPDLAAGGDWERLPAAAQGLALTTGLLAPPEPAQGVYRHHWLQVAQFGTQGTSPWALAARQVGQELPGGDQFRLDLRGGSARLARLPLDQVLAGGLVPELIRDRAVLVSLTRTDDPSLYTPVGAMTPAVFDGLALDSLLNGSAIRAGDPIWLVLTTTLVMLGGLILFQKVPVNGSLWLGLAIGLAYTALAWVVLLQFSQWPPLAEILAAHLVAVGLVLRYRVAREELRVKELVADLDTRLAERVAPESFYQADDHWAHVASMVTQYLNLHRTIFLERVPGDHRLREIRAVGCSLQDIDELRRDYERTPYSTAIAELGPVKLERSYLRRTEAEANEVQYLVPLIFASDVLGFWALTVLSQEPERVPEFLDLVANVAERVSELLHYRHRWRRSAAEQQDPLRALMRLEGSRSLSRSLGTSVVVLEQRAARLQEIFDTLPDHCILYDLFGRLVIANQHMEGLARELGLRPYDKTLVELTAQLTGTALPQVLDYLSYVVLRGGELTLPVPLADGRLFLLGLHAIHATELGADPDSDRAAPQSQDRHGVLLVLNDVTRFRSIDRLKAGVVERLFFQLRNDLTALHLSLGLLRDPQLSRAELDQILATLHLKLEQIGPRLVDTQQQLSASWDTLLSGALARYPVDGLEPLREALTALATEGTRADIRVEFSAPHLMSLVLAAPDQLRELFRVLLRLLFDDTPVGGRLLLRVSEEADGLVHYQLTNQGLGLAPDRLTDAREHAGGLAAKLRQLTGLAERWGGKLEIGSEEGVGLRFSLFLPTFLPTLGLYDRASPDGTGRPGATSTGH